MPFGQQSGEIRIAKLARLSAGVPIAGAKSASNELSDHNRNAFAAGSLTYVVCDE
jgi:hypothetical protein